jgi:hypothetical protein
MSASERPGPFAFERRHATAARFDAEVVTAITTYGARSLR